jgi:hypothetical protein
LLSHNDTIVVNGRVRRLVAKNIGCGVYEISKKPLKEEPVGGSKITTKNKRLLKRGSKMHYHCEVIMPKTKDIQGDLESILAPFQENMGEDEDVEWISERYSFWDFWVIGGRWAGTKETCIYDKDKIDAFYAELEKRNVTVSEVQCGKSELSPASQIPMVDELWCAFFPTETGEIVPCPIFAHSNNQYDSDTCIACDICCLEELPKTLTCSRVIIAGPDFDGNKVEAKYMLCDDMWNGVNFVPVTWDGKITTALEMFKEHLSTYAEKYKQKYTPKPDWLCITIDYHS